MVHIMWLPPLPAQQNGLISHYVVSLYSIETYETSQYNTSETSIQLTGLHPFYNYECHVAAVTVGPGPSKITAFQMAEDGIRHNLLLYLIVLIYSSTRVTTKSISYSFESKYYSHCLVSSCYFTSKWNYQILHHLHIS